MFFLALFTSYKDTFDTFFFEKTLATITTNTESVIEIFNLEANGANKIKTIKKSEQNWDGYYVENGAIYIFTREHFEKYKCRCSNRSTLYEMKSNSIFEIDDLDDKAKKNRWNEIRRHVSDLMIMIQEAAHFLDPVEKI